MTEDTALYVYALLPDRPDAADGVTGIDGRPLRLVRVPGTSVAALVHDAAPAPSRAATTRCAAGWRSRAGRWTPCGNAPAASCR